MYNANSFHFKHFLTTEVIYTLLFHFEINSVIKINSKKNCLNYFLFSFLWHLPKSLKKVIILDNLAGYCYIVSNFELIFSTMSVYRVPRGLNRQSVHNHFPYSSDRVNNTVCAIAERRPCQNERHFKRLYIHLLYTYANDVQKVKISHSFQNTSY